jgi:hypothetical protein
VGAEWPPALKEPIEFIEFGGKVRESIHLGLIERILEFLTNEVCLLGEKLHDLVENGVWRRFHPIVISAGGGAL